MSRITVHIGSQSSGDLPDPLPGVSNHTHLGVEEPRSFVPVTFCLNVTLTGYLKAMHAAENCSTQSWCCQMARLKICKEGRKGPDLESPSLHTHSTAA